MPTAEKAEKIEDLAQKLRASKGTVLLDYRGLNVSQITALRAELRAQEVDFQVAKNTLLRIAAEKAEVQVAAELLEGPTAVAFGWQDETAPARLLADYTRRNRVVSIKGGIVAGRSMSAAEIGRVAELPTREQLLAQVLGVLQAPMARTLSVLQAPAREVAGLAQALSEKLAESGQSAA